MDSPSPKRIEIIQKEDDENEEDIDLPIAQRRKKRVHVPPLRYWLGEKVLYKPTKDGLSTVGIVKCDSE